MDTKFEVGDRVVRPQDIYDTDGPVKTGTVTRRYSKTVYTCLHEERPFCSPTYYPELYEVRWDEGRVGKGYLPHGLIALHNEAN